MATKNMLVRVGADLSDLKNALPQAKAYFKQMRDEADSAAQNTQSGGTAQAELAKAQVRATEAASRKDTLAKQIETARESLAKFEAEYKRLVSGGTASAKLDALKAKYEDLLSTESRGKHEKALTSLLKDTEKQMLELESKAKVFDFGGGKEGLKFNSEDAEKQYNVLAERAEKVKAKLYEWRVAPEATEEAQKLKEQIDAIQQSTNEAAQAAAQKVTDTKARIAELEEEFRQAGEDAEQTAQALEEAERAAERSAAAAQAWSTVKAMLGEAARLAGQAGLALGKMGAGVTFAPAIAGFALLKKGAEALKNALSGAWRIMSRIVMYKAASALYDAAKTAASNLISQNSALSASFAQIQANIGAAAGAVLQSLMPAIQAVASAIASLTASIAAMIASLFGTTVKQASAAASAATGTAASAADELKRTVMSFDTLNKVDAQDSGSGGGGSSSTTVPDTSALTNADVPEWLQKVQKGFENLGEAAKNLRDNFVEAWNTDGIGDRIVEAWSAIGDRILDHWVTVTGLIRDWAASVDFTPLLTAFAHLSEAIEPVVDLICGGLEWAWQNVLLPLASWTIEEYLPATLETLADALEFLNAACVALEPAATWLWENFLQPLAEFTGDIIIKVIKSIGEVFNLLTGIITGDKEKIDDAASALNEIWNTNTANVTDNLNKQQAAREADSANNQQYWSDRTAQDTAGWSQTQGIWTDSNGVIHADQTEALRQIKQDWTDWWADLETNHESGWRKLLYTWKDGNDDLLKDLSDIAGDMYQSGKDMIDNFIKGIDESTQWLEEKVNGVASMVSEYWHFSVPDKGPLADADTWMPDMMTLFAEGIDANRSKVMGSVAALAEELDGGVNAAATAAVGRVSVQNGQSGGNSAVIAVLREGFAAVQKAVEEKEMNLTVDGDRVGRTVTKAQNRRQRMRGAAVSV